MLRIVVGGQINKKEIANIIIDYFKEEPIDLKIMNDLDAVMAIKAGQFDYYVGACVTGGGGALAMAMALLGSKKCKTIAMPGKIISDEEIQKSVNDGAIAFGFTAGTEMEVLPVLLEALKNNS